MSKNKAIILVKMLLQNFINIVGEMKDPDYVLKKARNIVEWLCDLSAQKPNLLIYGNAGSGKTTMAKAMRNILYASEYAGKTAAISAKEIGDIYRNRADFETWKHINSIAILFIDDLGMEEDVVRQYGDKAQPMATLIHNRYERKLHTIITTNLTSEKMAEKYDDRIMDRINSYARLSYTHISFRR